MQASEVKYGPEKQTGLAVEIHIFPNLGVSPPLFMTFGDPAIGLIAASAGAATPGANTGNGTISSIAVFSGITKSETITINMLDTVTGNDFSVTGSVSGALGVFHLAATSTSTVNVVPVTGSPDVINFTLTQGTVQFAIGDTFTIATTAANYV
jgi:hypothetical protein